MNKTLLIVSLLNQIVKHKIQNGYVRFPYFFEDRNYFLACHFANYKFVTVMLDDVDGLSYSNMLRLRAKVEHTNNKKDELSMLATEMIYISNILSSELFQ